MRHTLLVNLALLVPHATMAEDRYLLELGPDGPTAIVLFTENCGSGGCIGTITVGGDVFEFIGGNPFMVQSPEGVHLVVFPKQGEACTNPFGTTGSTFPSCHQVAVWDNEMQWFWGAPDLLTHATHKYQTIED